MDVPVEEGPEIEQDDDGHQAGVEAADEGLFGSVRGTRRLRSSHGKAMRVLVAVDAAVPGFGFMAEDLPRWRTVSVGSSLAEEGNIHVFTSMALELCERVCDRERERERDGGKTKVCGRNGG